MRILFIGTGYVGLVSGACFSEMGHDVVCLDINTEKISQLNAGVLPIFEPGLDDLVAKNTRCGKLRFASEYPESVTWSEVCVLAVDTPPMPSGESDLGRLLSAASSVASNMETHTTIIVKSTVPAGTARRVAELVREVLLERGREISFDVVSNPEFLREGDAINNCLKPDRVIIGSPSAKAEEIMRRLYEPFGLAPKQLLFMDNCSAELSKYACNAMLALRISFMNELSGLCELTGADIGRIKASLGSDPRIGSRFLDAGIGYGGSCFPKDISSLVAQARALSYSAPILGSISVVNDTQKTKLGAKVIKYFEARGKELEHISVAVLGLSFKPHTDDIREAPAKVLIEQLLARGIYLRLYDPAGMKNAECQWMPDPELVYWARDELDAITGADAVALVTEWPQFCHLDLDELACRMSNKAFFDGRNIYDPILMKSKGFDYFSIGREPVLSQFPTSSNH